MIYVHVPFCHRKCTYCAFYSKVGIGNVAAYVDAILEEMERRKGEPANPIQTVYFGGGTPSILPIEHLARIVEGLRRCFDLSQVHEVTIEANPEDLTPDYLQALDAAANARAAGFSNISVDFIYGLPLFPDNLYVPEGVTHVSAYALTVEPGTALAVQVEKGRVVLPDEEEVVRQYHALHQMLVSTGFEQYEVSNYARPGFRSHHNSRYWNRTPYLGLGPGAHSFDGRCRRWNNPDGTVGMETLNDADAYNELLMTALRTTDGLAAGDVPEGQRERLHQMMQPYVDCGWIVPADNRYVPTAEGLLHADGIAAALFIA